MRVPDLLVLLVLFIHPASGAGDDWMTSLPDERRLSELLIPGTHDAGALHEPVPGTSKCQDLTITGQLNAGVRFLDIRCRHVNDAFDIHHGMVFQQATFDDVLEEVIGFLEANPHETVIMSVMQEYKAEGNSRDFVETFEDYVSRNPERWWLGDSLPALGDVRGRIVLFRRFPADRSPLGIDASHWPGNTRFSSGLLEVQDRFIVPDVDVKWEAIRELFEASGATDENRLFVNFTSGYRRNMLGLPDITFVAKEINRRLDAWKPSGGRGIVVMDFANPERCRKLFEANGSGGE